jgi:hypothetical protein
LKTLELRWRRALLAAGRRSFTGQVASGPEPLVFGTGGISRYGQGALCATDGGDPVFVVRRIEQDTATAWGWMETSYRWTPGLILEQTEVRKGQVPIEAPITDPRVLPFYQLHCGPVRLS